MSVKHDSEDVYVHGMDWAEGKKELSLSNYKSYQYNLISKYIGERILEVGSGNRVFTNLISANHSFEMLDSIEPSDTLYELYKDRFAFPENVKFSKIDLFDLDRGDQSKYDTIIMIHVLEHIEEDRKALDHLHGLLDEGGYLLIEVPALPWLFSPHDELVGHFRRYDKKLLKAAISDDKYEIVDIWYQDPIGVFGSLLFFKLMKIKLKTERGASLVSNQGRFYDRYLIPMQGKIEKYIRFPFGLSLTAVVKKRAAAN